MTFEAEVARLTPLFQRAEREHRDLTALFKASGKSAPGYDDLLGRLRDDTRELEAIAERIRNGLREADAKAADAALAFLSVRARPFRSGYACAKIARSLKKAALNPERKALLRKILLERLTWPWSHTPDLWRCYPAVRTPETDAAVRALAESPTSFIARRARRLLESYA